MTRQLARDIAERAGWTFVQAFLAALTSGAVFHLDIGSLEAAGLAGLAAVAAMLKGFAASRIGVPTAALPDPN